MASLQLKGIVRRYAATTVIHGIDLEVRDGEFVVFVGPSGCGKSTLLRMISGLESVSEGELLIDGKRVNDVSAAQRGLAMVFQSYALYPHMTVYQNMAFGLENIRTYSVQFKSPLFPEKRITLRASVARKYKEGDENLVDCDLTVTTNDDETVITGSCTAALPSRG